MRSISRGLLALAVVLGPAIGIAQAITIKEIIQFKGLGPNILISLIEADNSVFHLTAEEASKLKEQGVPESVILAMIETAKPKSPRKTPVPPDQPAPPVEPPPDDLAASSDTSQAPVIVNVSQSVSQHVDAPATVEVPVPVAVPVIEHGRRPLPEPRQTQTQPAPSQQYWGYGGQKRPDSWGPTPAPPAPRNDTKADPSKGGGS